ncbi:MAG TPA: septal ring lytic transglycosylase RlpA family protein [Opitutaceae bacterium]
MKTWLQTGLLALFLIATVAAAAALLVPVTAVCMVTDAIADRVGRWCLASWYGNECRGRLMANGRPFNPDALTCASWEYALGTRLLVTRGDRKVVVTVTDRGPRFDLVSRGRLLDLSAHAFLILADPRTGVIEVTVKVLKQS